jgi:large subunit ribosomal protein L7/L12
VTASSPIVSVSTVATNTPVTEVAEEKTEFKLFLAEVPADKKIAILKVVRTITGLGLKEAKDLVEAAPKIIQEGLTKDASESAKKQVEEAGEKVGVPHPDGHRGPDEHEAEATESIGPASPGLHHAPVEPVPLVLEEFALHKLDVKVADLENEGRTHRMNGARGRGERDGKTVGSRSYQNPGAA